MTLLASPCAAARLSPKGDVSGQELQGSAGGFLQSTAREGPPQAVPGQILQPGWELGGERGRRAAGRAGTHCRGSRTCGSCCLRTAPPRRSTPPSGTRHTSSLHPSSAFCGESRGRKRLLVASGHPLMPPDTWGLWHCVPNSFHTLGTPSWPLTSPPCTGTSVCSRTAGAVQRLQNGQPQGAGQAPERCRAAPGQDIDASASPSSFPETSLVTRGQKAPLSANLQVKSAANPKILVEVNAGGLFLRTRPAETSGHPKSAKSC